MPLHELAEGSVGVWQAARGVLSGARPGPRGGRARGRERRLIAGVWGRSAHAARRTAQKLLSLLYKLI